MRDREALALGVDVLIYTLRPEPAGKRRKKVVAGGRMDRVEVGPGQ